MLQWWITPSTIVIRQGVVWRTEVGGSDSNGVRKTPFRICMAPKLITGSAAGATVEHYSAKRRRLRSISLTIQVSIPASTPYIYIHKHTNISNFEYRILQSLCYSFLYRLILS